MSGPGDDFYTRQGFPRPKPYMPPVPPPWNPPTVQSPVVLAPPGPPPALPPRPWWRRNVAVIVPWVLVVALAVTVLLLSFRSTGPTPVVDDAGPATRDVTVSFVLRDADTAYSGCEGSGGYSDIGSGTPVRITSASGEILGAASLGPGSNTHEDWCRWEVTIPAVRLGEAFYSAEVSDRGVITYSGEELAANDYRFELSLGA